jgi:outer membrane lipoprotein-sorting protein
VQPVACFLIASILTRKQNLIENVAASVEMFGLEYQQLVEGYRLLWERRENMRLNYRSRDFYLGKVYMETIM